MLLSRTRQEVEAANAASERVVAQLQAALAAAPSAARVEAARAHEVVLGREIECLRAELRAAYSHLPLVPRGLHVQSDGAAAASGNAEGSTPSSVSVLLASSASLLGPTTSSLLLDPAREETEGTDCAALAASAGGRGVRILHLVANPTSVTMRDVSLAQTGERAGAP